MMKTYAEAESELKLLLTDDFLQTLTRVACLNSFGDWTEIADMVRECHHIAGKPQPQLPKWPEFASDDAEPSQAKENLTNAI